MPPMSVAGPTMPRLPLATAFQVKLAENTVRSTRRSDLVAVPWRVIAGSPATARTPKVLSFSAGLPVRIMGLSWEGEGARAPGGSGGRGHPWKLREGARLE